MKIRNALAAILLTAHSSLLTLSSPAAVPLRWTVDTSRLQPVTFDALHGETLELAASFQSYGKPLAVTGPAALYYQTNGMGAAWWQIPATVASNRIEAVFPPSADPGAPRLICFLGGTASTYRAAFSLRFANSPGANPNTLPLPVTKLDLAAVEVLNAPWITADKVTNIVTAIAPKPEDYTTTNAVKDIVTDYVVLGFSDWEISGEDYDSHKSYDIEFFTLENHPYTAWPNFWKMKVSGYEGGFYYSDSINPDAIDLSGVWKSDYGLDDDLRLTVRRKVVKSNRLGLATRDDIPDMSGYVPSTRRVAGKPLTDNVTLGPADVGAASKDELVEIWNYMMAENFRVTVTNYDSTAHAPESSYEYRMGTNEPWRTVWTETNGLARTHTAATNDALKAAKAEIAKPENRAWGRYDSTTGAPAPEGIVQVSAEGGLLIGGGMGYTAVATSGGEYWVLTSTDPTLCRTGTNGVFEIIDSSGNAAVTVRKGDKRLVPAPSGGIRTSGDAITIVYRIESAVHPTLECAATLNGGGFMEAGADGAAFGAPTWSGGSGEWVATLPTFGNPTGFFRASYWTGGGTVVSYGAAAIEIPRIKIGNVEYTVGTATISGHTVLTLEARP